IASSTGRGYLVIITASCQKLKNPFLDRPDYQPNRAPKRPNATVNKFRFLNQYGVGGDLHLSLDRIRILVPDGPELGTLEQPAMQVYVYTLSFGSLCAHRSVNPRGNASAYTLAKPETVATPDLAVRLSAGLHVTRQRSGLGLVGPQRPSLPQARRQM